MDELVKRLWECASGECFNCSQYTETTNASVCSKELMKQAADAIEKLQKAVNFHKFNSEFWEGKYNSLADEKWIPVTERLPEVRTWVLCYCRANSFDVFRMTDEGDWQYGNRSIYMKGYVTHWMPLPQPPKEET